MTLERVKRKHFDSGYVVLGASVEPQEICRVQIPENEPAEAFIASVWPDYEYRQAGAPTEEELATVLVGIFIDEQTNVRDPAADWVVGGGMQSPPAVGMRRQITCNQLSIVVRWTGAPGVAIRMRGMITLGRENAEAWNVQHGGAPSPVHYAIPRFANVFRCYSWGNSPALLGFRDLTDANGDLPQSVSSAPFVEWTPIPVGAAALQIGQAPEFNERTTIQFGRV